MEEFSRKPGNAEEETLLDADKKMTLQPLHSENQITAEESDSELAHAREAGPAIANFGEEVETTVSDSTPAQSAAQRADALMVEHKIANPAAKSRRFPVSVAVVLIMIGILLFALLYR